MNRKSFILGLLMLVTLLGSGIGAGSFLLQHVPMFYAQAAIPPAAQRVADSRQFEKSVSSLVNQLNNVIESPSWQQTFRAKEINSWLAEDFARREEWHESLPEKILEPRVLFNRHGFILGFRYGSPQMNTIVSVEGRIWLCQVAPNTIALEIGRIRAGAVPLGIKSIQDIVTDIVRSLGLDIRWYRNKDRPVALLRFENDRSGPSYQLLAIQFQTGELTIRGRSFDPDILRAKSAGRTAHLFDDSP